MTKEETKIIKGEIENIGGYPVFELIIQGELKQVATLDDIQKVLDIQEKTIEKKIIEKIEKYFNDLRIRTSLSDPVITQKEIINLIKNE